MNLKFNIIVNNLWFPGLRGAVEQRLIVPNRRMPCWHSSVRCPFERIIIFRLFSFPCSGSRSAALYSIRNLWLHKQFLQIRRKVEYGISLHYISSVYAWKNMKLQSQISSQINTNVLKQFSYQSFAYYIEIHIILKWSKRVKIFLIKICTYIKGTSSLAIWNLVRNNKKKLVPKRIFDRLGTYIINKYRNRYSDFNVTRKWHRIINILYTNHFRYTEG